MSTLTQLHTESTTAGRPAELLLRMAAHLAKIPFTRCLASAKGPQHISARWFCVDMNQNTEDGIELVYIQSPTFAELAELLGITRHGLRHRAFEVPADEVDPDAPDKYPSHSLDGQTVQAIKSRFKYQNRKETQP